MISGFLISQHFSDLLLEQLLIHGFLNMNTILISGFCPQVSLGGDVEGEAAPFQPAEDAQAEEECHPDNRLMVR